MRKFTLIVLMGCCATGLLAQERCLSKLRMQPSALQKPADLKKSNKAETVYWSELFNDASWKSTVQADSYNGYAHIKDAEKAHGALFVDNTLNDFFFHWSDKGPRGAFTSPAGAFEPWDELLEFIPGTPKQGHLVLEADFYNTGDDGDVVASEVEMDADAIFGPIDLSAANLVSLRFNHMFRLCCTSNAELTYSVSSDYNPANPEAATWVDFDAKGEVQNNSYPTRDLRTIVRNITSYAANKSAVYLKFHMGKASHYLWIIDDIELFETTDSRIEFVDTWVDYWDLFEPQPDWDARDYKYAFIGGLTSIPAEVSVPYVQTRAATYNDGALTQTVQVHTQFYKDDVVVYDSKSDAATIKAQVTDTLIALTPYFAEEKGYYMVSSSLIGALPGNTGTNTSFGYEFEITDNHYSRVYDKPSQFWGNAGATDWLNNDKHIAHQYYLFTSNNQESVKIAGIRVFFPWYDPDYYPKEISAIKGGKYGMKAVAFTENGTAPFASSDYYSITLSDTGKWVYLPFLDEDNLVLTDAQEYQAIYVGIQCFTGKADNSLLFNVGTELFGPKQPWGGGLVRATSNGEKVWFASPDNYAIDLYLNSLPEGTSAPEATKVSENNLRVYPNPANNELTIEGVASAKQILISNILGQTVLTVPVVTDKLTVDLSSLEKGVYLITITDKNNVNYTKRIVKQ